VVVPVELLLDWFSESDTLPDDAEPALDADEPALDADDARLSAKHGAVATIHPVKPIQTALVTLM
jgi:hypothetical protein